MNRYAYTVVIEADEDPREWIEESLVQAKTDEEQLIYLELKAFIQDEGQPQY